jgi:ParB-like chromosome segregation protein Spo0J
MPTKPPRSTSADVAAMAVTQVAIDDLVPYPGNARRHDLPLLAKSLQLHGLYRPLTVQAGTMHVIAGNGTLEAAQSLGWATIACHVMPIDDDEARRINLIDNRSADVATYDMDDLVALLQPIDDLEGTGYSLDDKEDLIAQLGQVDQAPETTFEGGYVENTDRADPKPPLASSGLKEVILVFRIDELEWFNGAVRQLADEYGTKSVAATVLEALRRVG